MQIKEVDAESSIQTEEVYYYSEGRLMQGVSCFRCEEEWESPCCNHRS